MFTAFTPSIELLRISAEIFEISLITSASHYSTAVIEYCLHRELTYSLPESPGTFVTTVSGSSTTNSTCSSNASWNPAHVRARYQGEFYYKISDVSKWTVISLSTNITDFSIAFGISYY